MANQPKSLNQLKQRQRVLQTMVFTLVTVMIWTGFSLFSSQKKTVISQELKDLAAPLTPTINTQILDELEKKKTFSVTELRQFPIYKIIVSKETGNEKIVTIDTPEEIDEDKKSPSPQPSQSPSATSSADPRDLPVIPTSATPTPTATTSGNTL
jgi:hypothetical protein